MSLWDVRERVDVHFDLIGFQFAERVYPEGAALRRFFVRKGFQGVPAHERPHIGAVFPAPIFYALRQKNPCTFILQHIEQHGSHPAWFRECEVKRDSVAQEAQPSRAAVGREAAFAVGEGGEASAAVPLVGRAVAQRLNGVALLEKLSLYYF